MDNYKKRARKEYKRKWMAAKRKLNRTSQQITNTDLSSSSDEDSFIPTPNLKIETPADNDSSSDITKQSTSQEYASESLRDGTDEHVLIWSWEEIDAHMIESSESDDDDNTQYLATKQLQGELGKWASLHNVTQNAVDDLLKLLIKAGHNDLPKTARSLKNTPRDVVAHLTSGMDYVYLGLKEELLNNLNSYTAESKMHLTELQLVFNIDGLPIFKSTNSSLWPILCTVINLKPLSVFPVALTYGTTKPKNLDFLQDTINDLNYLIHNGLDVDEKHYSVLLRCCVCDAPAKAMVKNIKLYSGYYGCDKCSQKGAYLGRMTYPETENFNLRSDTSFRNQQNPEHHHGITPFCDTPLNMIKGFPADYMHQVCLGVQKRILLAWMRGKKETRISVCHVKEISERLRSMQRFIPKVFARKPRGLDEIDRWKATEYRQFLLYTGKIVLQGIIPDDLYNHFLVLSVAMCILVSENLTSKHSDYARALLKYFVEKSQDLYGREFQVYNVHSLLHLTDDAVEYGCLDTCSAFPFENYMQKFLKMVRSPKNPVAQIFKRYRESHPVIHELPSKVISCKRPNNYFIINDQSCCEVTRVSHQTSNTGERMYVCCVYGHAQSLFQRPCDSMLIGAMTVRQQDWQMQELPESQLKSQAIMIERSDGKLVFLAILHDF